MKIKYYLTCVLFTTFIANTYAQLVVNSNTFTEFDLLELLLGEGIQANSLTFNGVSLQRGFFDASNTNLEINEGIILATGNIFVATGPNDLSNATQPEDSGCGTPADPPPFSGPGGLCRPGDSDLDNILSSTTMSFDAAVFEFDFIPSFNTLLLDYVFASEEYPEYVCSEFNDVFAFLLSGPNPNGGSYNKTNLARIPGTNLPVAINTINPGTVGASGTSFGCTGGAGSLNFSDLYVDNAGGTSVQFDGFTTKLQMTAPVIANEFYTIKIAIADAGDGVLDSAVFLEGHSFKSVQITDIEDVEHLNTFNIQPNPSDGRFVVDAEFDVTQTATIQIINALGQEIYQSKNTKKHFIEQIDISNAPIGTYFVIIQTEKGKAVQKIAISR